MMNVLIQRRVTDLGVVLILIRKFGMPFIECNAGVFYALQLIDTLNGHGIEQCKD